MVLFCSSFSFTHYCVAIPDIINLWNFVWFEFIRDFVNSNFFSYIFIKNWSITIYESKVAVISIILFKISWNCSVKAKLKRQRPQLVSDTTVQAMRSKYGRPDISGRKRKSVGPAAEEATNTKLPRFKVVYQISFNIIFKTVKPKVALLAMITRIINIVS